MNSEELKEAKHLLKMLKSDKWYEYTDDAINTIYTWQENDNYGYFVDEDMLDEYVKHEAEGGVMRLMFFLRQADPSAPFGYRINAYGNLENVEKDDLIDKLEDIIEENEG